MTDAGAKARGGNLSRFWAAVLAGMGAVASVATTTDAIPKLLLDEQRLWLRDFLPDLAVGLFVVGATPVVLGRLRVDWATTARRLGTERRGGLAVLGLLVVAVLI